MQITGGYLKSRKIISPKGENVRPTLSKTRESVFNVLMNLVDFEEHSFLDLFAGSGIMGFEAISRWFADVVFVEKDRATFNLLKDNLKKLGIDSCKIYCADSVRTLKTMSQKFGVIYIDPPYRANLYNQVLDIIKTQQILVSDGIIVLEHLRDERIQMSGFVPVKQKNYSDKMITYLRMVD